MPSARGTFEVAAWDEHPYVEIEGRKMTLAVVTQKFSGDVDGTGEARWLMAYRADGTAHFVGLQRVEGAIKGRRGTFVMETIGDFDGELARWHAEVLDGCGDGDLANITGSGEFAAPHGSVATYGLDLSSGDT